MGDVSTLAIERARNGSDTASTHGAVLHGVGAHCVAEA